MPEQATSHISARSSTEWIAWIMRLWTKRLETEHVNSSWQTCHMAEQAMVYGRLHASQLDFEFRAVWVQSS